MLQVYPITFCIPNEKISLSKNNKTKILSNLIPGNLKTYIYNTEEDYYNEYKKSYFAITTKKAGWDCMRHYEILANNCIPYFIDIQKCPLNTMYFLPKQLLIKSNILYEKKFKYNNNFVNIIKDKFNISKVDYFYLEDYKWNGDNSRTQEELLEYTKNNLTTEIMAKYILTKTNHENVKKILYLSGKIEPDYLRCLILHGFKKLFGDNCHDMPLIPHIYKLNNINYNKLYGKGMSYSNLLEINLHNNNLDIILENNINNKYYDIIIYGSYHRGMQYYDLISKIYNPNEIILLCGEDLHNNCNYINLALKGHHIFIRELN